jgi:hypothetical protein
MNGQAGMVAGSKGCVLIFLSFWQLTKCKTRHGHLLLAFDPPGLWKQNAFLQSHYILVQRKFNPPYVLINISYRVRKEMMMDGLDDLTGPEGNIIELQSWAK